MTNSKERVTRSLYLEESWDRLPFGEWEIKGRSLERVLGRAPVLYNSCAVYEFILAGKRDEFIKRQVEDTVDLVKKLEIDILYIPFMPAETWRNCVKQIGENRWSITDESLGGTGRSTIMQWIPSSETMWEVKSSLNTVEALEDYIKALEQEGNPSTDPSTLELIEQVVKNVGDVTFICAAADGTFPFLGSATTMPIFLKCHYTRPDLVRRLLKEHARRQIEYGKAAIDAGVPGIVMNADYCYKSGPFMSPKQFTDFYLSEIRAHHDAYHKKGAFVIQHKDGNIWPIADALLLEAKADAFQAMEPPSGMKLAEMKAVYGDKICLMGNVDCAHTLVHGTVNDVVEETRQCIRTGAPGGGYIVSSSNVVVSQTPSDNYLALVETVKKYGKCSPNTNHEA